MTAPRQSLRLRRGLAAAQDGVTALEFALVAPVFLMMMLGMFDIGQMVYLRAVLYGAVEQAARSASLESGDTTTADNIVKNAVKPVMPTATITTTRKSYYDFTDVNRAEKFTDLNGNGTCNAGEPFIDENRSGSWDANVGKSGNGGAGDVVIYTVNVTYKPLFTVKWLSTWNQDRTLTAVGVRKNQPFAAQQSYGSSAGTCS